MLGLTLTEILVLRFDKSFLHVVALLIQKDNI